MSWRILHRSPRRSGPRPSRPVAALLLALPLLAGSPAPAAGQSGFRAALEGPPVTVRYAPGSLDRADAVKRRFERLVEQTGKKRWWRQPLLLVELVEAEAWRPSGLPAPFGLPAISAEGSLALPAWGTPESVALWRDLAATGLPSASATPLRGTGEEAAGLAAADLVGEVEGARLILARLGLAGGEPWINDLLACSLTASVLREHEAVRRAEAHRLFATLARHGELSGDERLRRLRWVAAADRIGRETGKLPAKLLLKMVRKRPEPLAAEPLLLRFPWLAELVGGGAVAGG